MGAHRTQLRRVGGGAVASEGVWGVMLIFLVISTGVGELPRKNVFHFGSARNPLTQTPLSLTKR